MTEGGINGERRIMADAIKSSPSNNSSFSSPARTPPNALHKSGPRTMPRTSSIDSAISSISSASHSQNPSIDLNTLTSADINNIISAAGSAEAVILHLLKDRQHAIARNDQLWRLLEKQRALVLGLNKDLERAIKDKDRYKKKLKELQGQAPPLPSNNQSPTQSLPLREAPLGGQKAAPTAFVDTSLEKQSDSSPRGDSLVAQHLKNGLAPSPLSVRHLHENAEVGITGNVPNLPAEMHVNHAAQFQSRIPPALDLPGLPPPNRKPPPAPLNLNQIQRRSSPLDPHAFQNSDSEYEDIDRGRRRTREDDDKEREAAVIREQEVRSRSKKMKNPEGASTEDSHASFPTAPTGVPSSPRQYVSQSPSQVAGGQFAATESLAAIVHSKSPELLQLADRKAMAPPTPGLPISPRPGDRPLGSPLPRRPREGTDMYISPPTSPRGTVMGLPQSPRATKQMSLPPTQSENSGYQMPSIDASVKIDSPRSPHGFNKTIYQGLISENYPGLLLPPNALPSIEVKVASSRLRPSRNSYMGGRPAEEDPVFILSVFSRFDRAELWRVEKAIVALPQLDQQVRQSSDFSGKLPDRSVFSGHSPAKIDARRDALNLYFETLLDTPMMEPTALVICRFLSSDAIEPRDDETNLMKPNGKSTPELVRGPDGKPRKEGYLTKRGKNFGGWKSRFFVLHGPELRYFESPGGAHLGTIKIPHAQIGKQSQGGHNQSPSRGEDDSDNQYRHAFLILEPKKKDSSALVRHVLCAESDGERDAWVDALLHYVEIPSSEDEKVVAKSHNNAKQPAAPNPKPRLLVGNSRKGSKGTDSPDADMQHESVQSFSYDDAVPAAPPVFGSTSEKEASRGSPTTGDNPSPDNVFPGFNNSKIISGPTNGAVIHNVGAWGNKVPTSSKEKKRSIWGFRARSSSDLAAGDSDPHNPSAERRGSIRPVFGMPLVEAVQFCGPTNIDVELPAVVYRCIEYLEAKGAASEEGIFRLSGSNVVIKALKERFNTEGDVDFLAGDDYYDVHAVASLFKQYLRELPTTVLTLELVSEFRRVPGKSSVKIS
jgi:RalA-binding protein 1